MEFEFEVRDSILGYQVDDSEFNDVYLVSGKQLSPIQRLIKRSPQLTIDNFRRLIQKMGTLSAKAQRLPSIITTYEKMRISSHNTYILLHETNPNVAIGFIRVGRKNLFLIDRYGRHHEVEPLCVLDFYVHEACQRKGHGLTLFKSMMQTENVGHPCQLAIDKPSLKFQNFLKKHYQLSYDIPQVNNYMVFDGFFRGENLERSKRSSSRFNAALTSRPAEEAEIFAQEKRKSRKERERLIALEAQANEDTGFVEAVSLEKTKNLIDAAAVMTQTGKVQPEASGVAKALFDQDAYLRHEFHEPPPMRPLNELIQRQDAVQRSSRFSSGERAAHSAGTRGGYSQNHHQPYNDRGHGDYSAQPLAPLHANTNRHSRLSSGSSGHHRNSRNQTPTSPPYQSEVPPQDRVQIRGNPLGRHHSTDPFAVSSSSNGHNYGRLSHGSRLPAIPNTSSNSLNRSRNPSVVSIASNYGGHGQKLVQMDPYYDQLKRQSSNFRDRLREAQGNSSWNVFGVPRSYTSYNHSFK